MKDIRLLEVKGYYNKVNMFEFTEEQSWKGHVILREDLTFEGIVVDEYANATTEDRLISGTLVDYNGVSLVKFYNHGFFPCAFYGMSNGKEIFGNWEVYNYINKMGRCKIIFKEIPAEEEIVESIMSKIEKFKEDMDEYSEEMYNVLIENMSSTVEQFLRNLEADKENVKAELGFNVKKLEL